MQKLPIKLYRAAQTRALDRLAIEEHGIPGIELMTRAGDALFQSLQNHWPEARSLAVFCGAGNNGGDGYIVARLALAAGYQVTVYAVSDPELLKGDARTAWQQFVDAGGVALTYSAGLVIEVEIIVDALLGTGLDRQVTGHYADAIAHINANSAKVLAVDIPSGLHADTGNVLGDAVIADVTVTFIGLKQGLFTGLAADFCGEIEFDSLTVPEAIFEQIQASATRVIYQPMQARKRCEHKGHNGHVLIVGGDKGFSGAARLAGEAALRVGSGLVSIATHPEHAGLMNINRPELMCHGVESVEQLLPLLAKATVIVLGPGLGQGDWGRALFNAVICSDKPLVVDADGLNLLASSPSHHTNRVLTPHPGEAARLLNYSTAGVQQDRFAAAVAIQAKYGGVAIVKGAGTVIASEYEMAVSSTGNPGMASGGMGDVLAGVIGGLLAQGLSLQQATQQGVYIHGLAADEAAQQGGERGLLASDLMSYLRILVN